MLVTRDGDGAVVQVDAGVYGLEGAVGGVAFLVAAYHIVAHPEGDDLFVVEHILDDDNRTAAFFISLLIGVFVLLTVSQFADTHTDAKLLATVRTLEDQ